jgi:nickel superoxide dismutase
MTLASRLAPGLTTVVLGLMIAAPDARAHCQVPCGIYDDPARLAALLEDVTTIERAVHQIKELSGKTDPLSLNQAVRWIETKDQHASHVITTVAEYFLTQKVKAPAPDAKEAWSTYLTTLADHHAVLVAAMKTKQTVDAEAVAALRKAVENLRKYWSGAK